MKARNSRIELLRIGAMLLIVVLHLIQNDNRFNYVLSDHSFNSACLIGLKLFSNIGVSIFALITGFFGISPSYRKLFALVFKTWFYSVSITFVFYICGCSHLKELVTVMIPLNSGHWYINAYVILIMLCTFTGDKINQISKGQFKIWLLIGFTLLYVFFWLSFDIGTNVVLVMYLYCLGRYIARFQPHVGGRLLSISFSAFILALGVLYLTGSQVIFKLLSSNYSPIVLLLSVSIFMSVAFKKRIDFSIVNIIGYRSLAVYLISEIHPVRKALLALQYSFDYNVLFIVCFAIGIYMSCFFIDWFLSPIETYFRNRAFHISSIIIKKRIK